MVHAAQGRTLARRAYSGPAVGSCYGPAVRRVLLCVVLAAASAPSTSQAEDVDPAAWLRQGVELRRQDRNEEALELFQRAWAASPTPVARAQIALAEQALGRWVEAEHDLVAAMGTPDDPWIAKNEQTLEDARAEIARHLGWLTVGVDVADARIELDGRALAAGVEERVVAGGATLVVQAPGRTSEARHIEVEPGAHARIAVVLTPIAEEPAAPPPSLPSQSATASPETPSQDTPRRHASLIAPAAFAAAGVAGIGLGTYFGFRTLDDKRARDAACTGGVCAPSAATDDRDARTASTVSTVAIGAGVGAVAAGAAWYLRDRIGAGTGENTRLPGGPAIALGVLGITGVALGTYFEVQASQERSARDAQCVAGCTPAGLEHDSNARTAVTVSTLSFGLGLAALADGAVLWWVQRSRGAATPVGWNVVPLGGAGVAGLSIAGLYR